MELLDTLTLAILTLSKANKLNWRLCSDVPEPKCMRAFKVSCQIDNFKVFVIVMRLSTEETDTKYVGMLGWISNDILGVSSSEDVRELASTTVSALYQQAFSRQQVFLN